jgi:glycerol-3-phosphate O-acyltransferase
VTGWLGRRARRTLHEFRTRLARYHLQQRGAAKAALTVDPVVETAILRHAQEHSLTHADVRRRVEQYVDEIVPQLNVLSYYKIGYNLAKVVLKVTPVPLAAAALLSFGQTVISKAAVLERMEQLRDRLGAVNAKVVRGGARIHDLWDRAWRMLRMRRLAVEDGDSVIVLPRGRPLLEFYANSIAHLLPIRSPRVPFHKAHELDADLPRLRRSAEDGGGRGR